MGRHGMELDDLLIDFLVGSTSSAILVSSTESLPVATASTLMATQTQALTTFSLETATSTSTSPTTSAPTSSSNNSGSDALSNAALIGTIIGSLLGAIGSSVGIYFAYKTYKMNKEKEKAKQ